MKLIITGCARSGTTLMIHLMQYFYNCRVMIDQEEHPFDFADYNHKDHILVIKKPFLTPDTMEYFSFKDLSGWKIIWMLRDGRDVVSSKHQFDYHVDAPRWCGANLEMLKNHNDVHLVRYEQLAVNPESVMKGISKWIEQDYQTGFLNFHEQALDSPMNFDLTPRPIDANSIGNWKNHEARVQKAYQERMFSKLLKLFGYD